MSSTKPITSNLVNVMQKIVKASPRRAFWLALAMSCLSALVVIPLARTRAAGPSAPVPPAPAAEASQTGSVPRPISVLNGAAATRTSFDPRPFTIGTCDTAGPIEIEATLTGPGPTAYATLKAAFDAINAGTHTGAISIEVCGDTSEGTATAALNASGAGSASYSQIIIRPSGGVARTISGATTAGNPMIDLNGADNVTINGQNTGGDSLTISNTSTGSTSGTSTIRLQADATNNLITNASILGSATMAAGTNGGNIWFGAAAVSTGSDNNTVSNCNIGPAGANLPTKGVYFSGSSNTDPGTANSGIIINNNNIFDYFSATVSSAGIDLNSGSVGTQITNNRFYQTATRTMTTTSLTHSAIRISNTSGAYTITGNTIGFASSAGTGTYTVVATATSPIIPINLSVNTTPSTSVQNNTIAGIAISGASSGTSSSAAFRAIYVGSGLTNIGDTTGNTIGSQSVTGSITYTSSSTSASDVIGIFNFGSSNWTVSNNTVGGITASSSSTGAANVYGIRLNTGSTVTTTISNNTVGGTVANSLQSTAAAATTGTQVAGIFVSTSIATVNGNTIRNLTAPGGTGTTTAASVVGIAFVSATPVNNVAQNTIFNLSNTNPTTATVVTGIQFTGGTGNIVERNLIHSLTSLTTSTTAEINGIRIAAGTTTYRNNMIAIGAGVTNAIGTGAAAGINGINEPSASGTDSFFHNSVYIGGTPSAGVGPSFAFNSLVTTNTRSFRDNIFFNARSNGAATGKNYAVQVGGTAANPSGLTLNNNVYFANGTGGVFGRFNSADVANLAAWKTAVGQDASSFESNPQYNDPTNATPDLHLHPTNSTLAEGNGADVGVTNDFDGQTRSGLTPVDIGADAGNFSGVDLAPPVITYTALGNTSGTGDRTLNISVTDVTGVPTAGVGLPVIYYRKNALAYVNSQCSFVSGSNYTCPILSASLGGLVAADTVSYYVAAQDTAATPNVTTNPLAGAAGFTANPPAAATPPTTPNGYTIAVAYAGSITVGTGGTFASLTNTGGLFQALNAGVLTGNITIDVLSNLTGETGTVALNQLAEEGVGNYTMTIRPSGAPRSITGTGSGAILIKINGADRVTIDGSTSGGTDRSLTLNNTNTATGTGTLFIASLGTGAGANNVTVKNCIIRAGSIGTTSIFTFAVFVGDTSGASAGADNDNLTIQNNQIMMARTGIQAVGTAAGVLDNLNINGNLIGDNTPANSIGRTGMTVQVLNNASISGNTVKNLLLTGDTSSTVGIQIVQSANSSVSQNTVTGISATGSSIIPQGITALTATTGLSIDRNIVDGVTSSSSVGPQGISVSTGVTGSSVTRNTVTNISYTGTGGYGGKGIEVSTGSTTSNVTVANNFVSNIKGDGWSAGANILDTTMGIRVIGTTGGVNLYNNTVNLASGSFVGNAQPATVSAALYIASTATTLDVRNNILTNNLNNTAETDDKNYAFYSDAANTAFTNINYNDYFVTASTVSGPQVLGFLGSDRLTLADIQTATGKDAQSISGNPLLTSATDLHIASGSPARNAGTTIATVTVDYDGDARPLESVYDIGADEYAPDVTAPVISYTPLTNIASVSDRTITVTASDSSGVNSMTVVWNNNGNAGTLTNPCTLSSGTAQSGTWSCTILSGVGIPPMTNPGTVAYYVSADDSSANLANNPSGATFTGGTRNMFTVGTGGTIDVSTVNSFQNLIVGDGFTFNGNATVNGTLTLAGGLLNTGNANTLTIACGASIAGGGAANYITGNLREMMCAPGAFNFPVGTASGYSPVDANVTAVGGGGTDSLTVRAVGNYYGGAGETPSLNPTALQRYWDLNEGGSITADIKWTFLPGDVVGGGTNYRVTRVSGVNATTFVNAGDCPANPVASPCVNIAGNYFYMAGVSTFSKWTAGQQLAPTAVGASIGGRILDANGQPIAHALVVLSGGGLGAPVVVQTGPFGYYLFNDIPVGQLYVVTVRSGRHTFTEPSRAIDLSGNVANADFVAAPPQ